eukprot:PLAT14992.1.p1 GENE.PLAT14992.1~~PLAT14992.1.p1  ORF type:complete len:171 (+),score=69.89 PLAT14992.1:54-566(+)
MWSFVGKVGVLYFFLIVDLMFNSSLDSDDTVRATNLNFMPVILFGAQAGIQVLNALVLFLLMSGTYLFKVGLLNLLGKEFRAVLLLTPLYFLLTCIVGGLRAVALLQDSNVVTLMQASQSYGLFILHRVVAAIFYVVALRASVKLADPRLYSAKAWVEIYTKTAALPHLS